MLLDFVHTIPVRNCTVSKYHGTKLHRYQNITVRNCTGIKILRYEPLHTNRYNFMPFCCPVHTMPLRLQEFKLLLTVLFAVTCLLINMLTCLRRKHKKTSNKSVRNIAWTYEEVSWSCLKAPSSSLFLFSFVFVCSKLR